MRCVTQNIPARYFEYCNAFKISHQLMWWEPRITTIFQHSLEMSIHQLSPSLCTAIPYLFSVWVRVIPRVRGIGNTVLDPWLPVCCFGQIRTVVFRNTTPSSLDSAYKRCGGICNLQIQGKNCNKLTCVTLTERFRWGIIIITILYIIIIIINIRTSLKAARFTPIFQQS